MRPISLRKAGATAIAGGLVILSGTYPIILGADGMVKVLSVRDTGVVLHNAGDGVVSGTLIVEVVIHGNRALMRQPFTVWGGQKVFVSLDLATRDTEVLRVGIIVDDGVPI